MVARDCESRVALAMLPVGAAITIGSALAIVAVAGLALVTLWRQPDGTGWWLGWCLAAAVVALYTLRRGIETMSTFDWREAVPALAPTLAIFAGYPAWWL